MLDLTVFNLPRGLVALSGYRPQSFFLYAGSIDEVVAKFRGGEKA